MPYSSCQDRRGHPAWRAGSKPDRGVLVHAGHNVCAADHAGKKAASLLRPTTSSCRDRILRAATGAVSILRSDASGRGDSPRLMGTSASAIGLLRALARGRGPDPLGIMGASGRPSSHDNTLRGDIYGGIFVTIVLLWGSLPYRALVPKVRSSDTRMGATPQAAPLKSARIPAQPAETALPVFCLRRAPSGGRRKPRRVRSSFY
mmetsp:Transcript_109263/g.308241  ORF Transcript_109263/g.308241 Transcript_109263/m.308241 type:complete len:204 (+) Transcript_109263:3771-4382(+)